MASEQSRIIRAGFVRDSPDIPIEIQRQQWEESALQVELPTNIHIEALTIGGISCEWIKFEGGDPAKVILYVHGGGFSTGSCKTHRDIAARLAIEANIFVLLVDYRLAPEHPFPAAIEDITTIYRWLIGQGTELAMVGDSAGGGLVVSTLLHLQNQKDSLPAAVVLFSPWLDLTMSGDSIRSRAQDDPLVTHEGLSVAAELYVGDADIHHPLLSPLDTPLRDLPPMLIHVGDHEILLSDAVRLAQKATRAELHIWEEMWHFFPAWASTLPEGQQALEESGQFINDTFR
jgi:epsilon-lactone hydrolase